MYGRSVHLTASDREQAQRDIRRGWRPPDSRCTRCARSRRRSRMCSFIRCGGGWSAGGLMKTVSGFEFRVSGCKNPIETIGRWFSTRTRNSKPETSFPRTEASVRQVSTCLIAGAYGHGPQGSHPAAARYPQSGAGVPAAVLLLLLFAMPSASMCATSAPRCSMATTRPSRGRCWRRSGRRLFQHRTAPGPVR